MTCNCKNLLAPCYGCLYPSENKEPTMTETLSAEEVIDYRRDAECNHDFSSEQMFKALNTIEAKDKEIEALKGQVAELHRLLHNIHTLIDAKEIWRVVPLIRLILTNHPDVVRAFEPSIRADEREKAIRECYGAVKSLTPMQYEGTIHFQVLLNLHNISLGEIQALLTKEQA